MRDELLQHLKARYGVIKSQFPVEGRRRWQIRALKELWDDPNALTTNADPSSISEVLQDPDPFDHITKDCIELGILLRTDFANEAAWQDFVARLQAAEKDFIGSLKERGTVADKSTEGDGGGADESKMDVSDSDDDSDDEEESSPIIKLISPDAADERARFTNISNLTALRLFNDVDIRPAPTPPTPKDRISPPNPLIDVRGWQEVYSGVGIWIYDAKSNTDQSVRQVSQEGHFYGTATGDSWRARVSHVCELQFNMAVSGMKINFGELDRWEYSQRKRNLDEAAAPL
ncbi:hypothetical protein BDN71DRAFT_1494799 [Pleurotus eryngii]|uniref:Uncharacterized protein n=1 Tax=Pleurotus eryngii TaxID=5323 RepID=A0A9P6A4W2_PLEER|nr:hypothetical protein BDN71DRAFT_1494799 [Pleurotus eryngii]